jgi:rubredoxin
MIHIIDTIQYMNASDPIECFYMEGNQYICMQKMRCMICGYVYDPIKGEGTNPPETPFEKLPDDWKCPICRASKAQFMTV